MSRGIGLEIGATAIRAVVLEQRGAAAHVITATEVSWGGGSGQALAAALSGIRRVIPLSGATVVVGVPASTAIIATVEPLMVEPSHADTAVRFELQQRLPYDVSQAIWHYQWWTTNGSAASSSTVSRALPAGGGRIAVVAAIKDGLAGERLDACRQAGIAVSALQISAMAAVNVWWASRTASGVLPTVLLHLDGSAAEWILVGPNGLEVIPGGTIPSTGATQGSVDLEQPAAVESLKGSWESVRQHISAGSAAAAKTPMVCVVGSVARGSEGTRALAQALGCPIRLLALESVVTVKDAQRAATESMVVAAGLALQALRASRWPLNLLTERLQLLQTKRVTRVATMVSVVAGVLAVACVARGMLAMIDTRQRVLQHLIEQEQLYQHLRPEVRRLRERQAALEHRLQYLDSIALLQGRAETAFQRMAQALPDTAWLTTAILTKTAALEGTLEGRARSFQGVTQLVEGLKSAGWETVKPLSTTVVTDSATGAEQIAFAVKVQQPLPSLPSPQSHETPLPRVPPSSRTPPPRPMRGTNAARR